MITNLNPTIRSPFFFVFIIVLISTLSGCSEIDEPQTSLEEPGRRYFSRPLQVIPNTSGQQRIPNELVVRYRSGIPETKKQDIRTHYKVKTFKQCSCADKTLELWIFDLEDLNGGVEEIKGEASSDPDLEGTDFQYLFDHPTAATGADSSDLQQMQNLVVSGNSGITVAIIDSGLDFGYQGFNSPFLYNSQETDEYCVEDGMAEISGWDFVNGDNVPEDAHGHGTIVATIIKDYLESHRVDFRILPIRAFDENGQGTLFNIVCAASHAFDNPDVDIVNMSFGWYYEGFEILPQLISAVEGEKLIVCSSGNQGVNSDDYKHYPSSYEFTNILSVGGVDSLFQEIPWFANFGYSTVDLAAPSEGIGFMKDTATIYVNGTSFSSAFATAKAALLFESAFGPEDQILWIVDNGVSKSYLYGKTKYGKLLIP